MPLSRSHRIPRLSRLLHPSGGVPGPTPIPVWPYGEVNGLAYDPFSVETLYQNDNETVPILEGDDGAPVGFMGDPSPNGIHQLQATASRKPIYRTDGTLRWLELNGTKWMRSLAFPTAFVQPWEIMHAAVMTTQYSFMYDGGATPGRWFFVRRIPTSTIQLAMGTVSGGNTRKIENTEHTTFPGGGIDAPHVIWAKFDGASSDVRIDAADFRAPPGTGPYGVLSDVGSDTLGSLTLFDGVSGNPNQPLNGKFFGMVALKAFTRQQRLAQDLRLAERAGIGGNWWAAFKSPSGVSPTMVLDNANGRWMAGGVPISNPGNAIPTDDYVHVTAEGTLFVRGAMNYTDNSDDQEIIFLRIEESSTRYLRLLLDTNGSRDGQPRFYLRDTAGGSFNASGGNNDYAPGSGVPYAIAASYGAATLRASADGGAVFTQTAPSPLPNMIGEALDLNRVGDSGGQHTHAAVAYYPKQLSDSDLTTMSGADWPGVTL